MAERKKVIVVTGASQGIGGESGQRISQRGLPCCRHVTINKTCAVAPGVIKTPMLPEERHDLLAKLHPVGRIGDLSDVVGAILYLETAPFVTGEIPARRLLLRLTTS